MNKEEKAAVVGLVETIRADRQSFNRKLAVVWITALINVVLTGCLCATMGVALVKAVMS